MTNPNNSLGTNGALGGRTSVNAFNDVLATFDGAGIVSGFVVEPDSGMTVAVGGDGTTRDVAVAEDPFGNRTTVDNISGDPISVTINTASTTSARIDSIVAYVNSPAQASDTSVDNPTACGIIAVSGTSGGAPLDSAIRTAITADGGTGSTAYYVVIANVSVPANTTTITSGLISAGKSINLSKTATPGSNGLMSGADKTKLDNLSAIPSNYIVLNGVASSASGAYINTGFIPNQDTRVILDFASTSTAACWICGARIAANNATFSLRLESTTNMRTDYGDTISNLTLAGTAGSRYIADKDKNTTSIKSGCIATPATITAQTFNSTNPLYIFTNNNGGSASTDMFVGTIFWVRIYDNGTLVRDYVPVYNKTTNSVGFYDKINGQFYANAGSGSLIGV